MRDMFKRIVLTILTVLCLVFIFTMSAAPSDESEQMSLSAGAAVCRVFVPGYRTMSAAQQERLARFIDHPVRKAAHMTEFGITGLCMVTMLAAWDVRMKQRVITALLFVCAYAGSDEFHQRFVPGRSGRIQDVFIDCAGTLIGLGIYCLWQHRRKSSPAL